jgi:TonB family protein
MFFYYFRCMKKITVLLFFILALWNCSHAQKIEKYFDFRWKECPANEARFYALIENTDSGWVRHDYFLREKKVQMIGKYKDSACKISDGYFYFFHANGLLQSTGRYLNNKKNGLWIGVHPNGAMSDSTMYDEGEPTGTSIQWHSNGYISDSTVYKDDGTAVAVSWFDDGGVSSAGRLNMNKYHGKWQFFHRNGKLSASEIYDNGKLVDRKYFSEDGTAMSDTTDKTNPPTFQGGIPGWIKYLEKKLYFPANYQIVNGDKAVVVINFTIDETGAIKDVSVQTPFHRAFDDIALLVVKGAPKWIPAMNHNRKVKYQHTQAVTFNQVIN